MNTKYISDENYVSSSEYQNYLNSNKGKGYLMIRANAASLAIPIEGWNIIISKVINNDRVIFYEGTTDSSGMIKKIELPAPIQDENNLDVPLFATYKIEWNYPKEDLDGTFSVNIYDDICTAQNIIITPNLPIRGYSYGN